MGIGRKLDCEALAGVIGINQRHLPSLYISNASLYCLRSLSSRIAKVMNEFWNSVLFLASFLTRHR